VEDAGHWFNQNQTDRFNEFIVTKTGNPNIAREAGRFTVSSESIGAAKQYALGLVAMKFRKAITPFLRSPTPASESLLTRFIAYLSLFIQKNNGQEWYRIRHDGGMGNGQRS